MSHEETMKNLVAPALLWVRPPEPKTVSPTNRRRLFSRFGRDLPSAWDAHLGYNLDQLVPSDPLITLGAYGATQQPRLREAIARLRSTPWSFGLNHGDLSLRNVLVPPEGRPVLINWGSASAGPMPFTHLLTLAKAHRSENDPVAREKVSGLWLMWWPGGRTADLPIFRPNLLVPRGRRGPNSCSAEGVSSLAVQ